MADVCTAFRMFFIMQGWGVHPEPAEQTEVDVDAQAGEEGGAPISEKGLVRD